MKLLTKLEDRLFWWLDRRWRDRATVEQLKRHREWMALDISVKEKADERAARGGQGKGSPYHERPEMV
jgi:hypothetical protein